MDYNGHDVGTNMFSLEIKMQIKGADKNLIGRNGKDVLEIIHAYRIVFDC